MDILFIGGVFPKAFENEVFYKSRGVVQFAANALQWNIINGLDICNGSPVSVLNSVFIGSYPKFYSDFYIKSDEWSHKDGAHDNNLGFLNLFGIKHIWRAVASAKRAVKWAHNVGTEQKVIIVYSMHTPFLYAAAKAKHANPQIHICLIVPDLPEFMNTSQHNPYYYRYLKAFDILIIEYLLRSIDSFVLLTKHMTERINGRSRPWIVMEGMVNPDESAIPFPERHSDCEDRVLLYTGTLNKTYGIMQLLEAFQTTDNPLYRLWICGAGEAEPDVIELAKRDHRVKYFGQVTREESLTIQRLADVLIDPRGSEGEFTKYSFPSKIMEYLLSGIPAIVHNLPGMPEDYHDHVYLFEDESVEGIATTVDRILQLPKEHLHAKGAAAKEFVLREKNNIVQTQRVIEMITTTGHPNYKIVPKDV